MMRGRRPTVSKQVKRSIAEKLLENQRAVEAGLPIPWIYRHILAVDGTSHGTIFDVKKSLGLTTAQLAVPQIQQPESQDVPEPSNVQNLTPDTVIYPADYVKAFEARYDEFKALLTTRDYAITQLESKNKELRNQINQMQFHLANYSGPSSNMGRSLGNGG
jgi:hypothetical protein